MTELPKISCLMVTLDRLPLVRRSVERYCRQTYPSRELVITPDGGPEYRRQIEEHVASLKRTDVRVVAVDEKCSWGRLQNIGMQHATGDLMCVWDDDDLYHPQRLMRQYEMLAADDAAACMFADYLHYFPEARELYWCDYTHMGGLPGSILYRAGVDASYPETGPNSRRGGDEVFKKQIAARHNVTLLKEEGYLYVYVCHGGNIWNEGHHRQLARRLMLPMEQILPRLPKLFANLRVQLSDEPAVTLLCRGGQRLQIRLDSASATS